MAKRNFIKVTKTTLIGCAVVTALSVVGVGYASWNDSVSIISKVSTGEMDVNFSDAYFVDNSDDDNHETGNPKENELIIDGKNSNTIVISGTVYSTRLITLKYEIDNDSTVPLKEINTDKVIYGEDGYIDIKPGSGMVHINIPEECGNYKATAPIEFESKYGSWKETLYIDIDITFELDKDDSIEAPEEDSLQLEQEITETLTTTSSPTSVDISETLDELSDAVIVE